MSRRVVITGIGYGLPGLMSIGDAAWRSLVAGESQVHPYGLPDDEPFDPPDGRPEYRDDADLRDRWPGPWQVAGPGSPFLRVNCGAEQLAHLAGQAAMRQAGLGGLFRPAVGDPNRFGLSVGGSKGFVGYGFGGPLDAWDDRVATGLQPSQLVDSIGRLVPHGRRSCPVAACATGLVSAIQATQWIRWGETDTVLAGSADCAAVPLVMASYRRLGVLCPSRPRPFDRDRDGFVIGEGVGMLILDDERAAAARGTEPLAVIAGEDMRSDAAGLVAADPSGEAVAVCVGNAIESAALDPSDIDAICLHGTGTRQNDLAEGRGLRRVFRSGLDDIPAVSVKGAWGHTLGASGALETAVAVEMLRRQVVPPHVGLRQIDPACEVANLTTEAREHPIRHVLKLSLGFGGHLAAAVLSRA